MLLPHLSHCSHAAKPRRRQRTPEAGFPAHRTLTSDSKLPPETGAGRRGVPVFLESRPARRPTPSPLGPAPRLRPVLPDPLQTHACAEWREPAVVSTLEKSHRPACLWLLMASYVIPLLSFPQPTPPSRFSIEDVDLGPQGGHRGERGRERDNLKQAPRSAQSPMQGSIPPPWDYDLS
ncbi:uncharacterized protein LOC131490188 isoform X2 [Neofelis nebulosa]|uniref:uncharacterized protein LOC131490188 isoform X2 n=1 Tax=Neofelis nebulosa TaxID=61452 RepID=UPI002729A294|nr:uncharacterized protein LOC131490188 isoform X2 [Neofelis nebulosa]